MRRRRTIYIYTVRERESDRREGILFVRLRAEGVCVCVMSLNECKRNEEKEEPPLGLMVKFLTILPPYKKGDCCNLPGWSQKTTTTTTARERERG
jgi:hypothetical protein